MRKSVKTLYEFFLKTFPAFLLVLFFAGCNLYGKVGEDDVTQGALPELLRGEWVYIQPGLSVPAERFTIEGDIIQYDDYSGGDFSYKGKIELVSNFNEDSGVIIIQYTNPPSYPLYNGNSFFGIYYRNLGSNSVQLANSINPDYSAPDTATLEEAIQKFTLFNMGDYVNWGVVQPQTRVR